MQNGLIIGALLSLKFLFSTQENLFFSILTLSLSVFIIFALYMLAVRFRETECEGIISYKRAFSFIFQIYFFGTILSGLVMLVYTQFIDTSYLGKLSDNILKLYEAAGYPIDDNLQKFFEIMYKPAKYALLSIFASVFAGAFWGAILAAFVKKEKSIFEQ